MRNDLERVLNDILIGETLKTYEDIYLNPEEKGKFSQQKRDLAEIFEKAFKEDVDSILERVLSDRYYIYRFLMTYRSLSEKNLESELLETSKLLLGNCNLECFKTYVETLYYLETRKKWSVLKSYIRTIKFLAANIPFILSRYIDGSNLVARIGARAFYIYNLLAKKGYVIPKKLIKSRNVRTYLSNTNDRIDVVHKKLRLVEVLDNENITITDGMQNLNLLISELERRTRLKLKNSGFSAGETVNILLSYSMLNDKNRKLLKDVIYELINYWDKKYVKKVIKSLRDLGIETEILLDRTLVAWRYKHETYTKYVAAFVGKFPTLIFANGITSEYTIDINNLNISERVRSILNPKVIYIGLAIIEEPSIDSIREKGTIDGLIVGYMTADNEDRNVYIVDSISLNNSLFSKDSGWFKENWIKVYELLRDFSKDLAVDYFFVKESFWGGHRYFIEKLKELGLKNETVDIKEYIDSRFEADFTIVAKLRALYGKTFAYRDKYTRRSQILYGVLVKP